MCISENRTLQNWGGKKSPYQPRVPALNNHQIKSEVHTSTGCENTKQRQPRTGQRATHVPDPCVWAGGERRAQRPEGASTEHGWRGRGIPGKPLAAAEVRVAPCPPGRGWFGASCSTGEQGQALWANPRWGWGAAWCPEPLLSDATPRPPCSLVGVSRSLGAAAWPCQRGALRGGCEFATRGWGGTGPPACHTPAPAPRGGDSRTHAGDGHLGLASRIVLCGPEPPSPPAVVTSPSDRGDAETKLQVSTAAALSAGWGTASLLAAIKSEP